jgi:hypothetical protein
MGMTVKISAGGIDLDAALRGLFRSAPEQAMKTLRMAATDSGRRIGNKGRSIANKRYAYADRRRAKQLRFDLDFVKAGDKFAAVAKFSGRPGVPLSAFVTSPRKAPMVWTGVPNARRRPKGGVRIRILRGGPVRQRYRSGGASVFWARAGAGAILAHRNKQGRLAGTGLQGPSPIQAIQKTENSQFLEQYGFETMAKRLAHQIDRMIDRIMGGKR